MQDPFNQSRSIEHRLPNLGYGIGLRPCHTQDLLRYQAGEKIGDHFAPDWLEVITENVMDDHGVNRRVLHQIAESYPLVFHGVSLSVGSSEALNIGYLNKLKQLCAEFSPVWISDHLCWTSFGGINSHDLLPMPLHQHSLSHLIARVNQIQDFLGRRLILENPSSYLHYLDSDMLEWEFLNSLCDATGAGILLDINNIYVSAFNLGFNANDYIQGITPDHVVQIHLAGPQHCGTHIIDTHDSPVPEVVWQLYTQLIRRTGPISCLLEWDANIPEFHILLSELAKARDVFPISKSNTKIEAAVTIARHDKFSMRIAV
ncbi:MNIO family bufferin maturase [Undibacterium baiyunense]|uniref:DUF692 domain-containing protein n=1 Tax=Undibacterium baiyunense TaxID=2828731 RepID=A0A941DEY7_9BURK|nr:DUF692 domain-containing protein [Undibacterium baiyunense]MBR7746731.1 DUF692 domain-containing protein [Undibacterium baiyunense]